MPRVQMSYKNYMQKMRNVSRSSHCRFTYCLVVVLSIVRQWKWQIVLGRIFCAPAECYGAGELRVWIGRYRHWTTGHYALHQCTAEWGREHAFYSRGVATTPLMVLPHGCSTDPFRGAPKCTHMGVACRILLVRAFSHHCLHAVLVLSWWILL